MKSWQLTDQIIRPKQEPRHRPLQYETPCATRKNTDQDSDGITGRITDQHHLSTPQPLHHTTLPPPHHTNTPPTTPPTTPPSVSPTTAPQAHHPAGPPQRNRPTGARVVGTPGTHLRNTQRSGRHHHRDTATPPKHEDENRLGTDRPTIADFPKIVFGAPGHRQDTARTPPEHTTGTPPGHQEESRPGHRPRTIADFPKTGASTNLNRVRSTLWLLGNKIRHVMLSWRMADRQLTVTANSANTSWQLRRRVLAASRGPKQQPKQPQHHLTNGTSTSPQSRHHHWVEHRRHTTRT